MKAYFLAQNVLDPGTVSRLERIFEGITEGIIRRRVIVSAIYIAFCLSLLVGAFWLSIDFSARAFFGRHDNAQAQLDAHQARWGNDDGLVVAVIQSSQSDLLAKDGLAKIASITKTLSQAPGVLSALSVSNIALPRGGAGLAFENLVESPLPKNEILSEPLLVPALVSSDGKNASVLVALKVPSDDIAAVRDVVAALDAALIPFRSDTMQVELGGRPVVRTRLLGLILNDQVFFVPLSALLMALLLLVLFRRFHGVFLPLLAAFLPAALLMGIMGYMRHPIGVINQVYFTLLPVIAISGGVHVLSRYYEEARARGVEASTLLPQKKRDAVVRALALTGAPCFFSALTTVVGLLSLQVSSMPVLRNFGLFSAMGIALAFSVLLIPFPLILSTTRGRVVDVEKEKSQVRINRVLQAMGHISLRSPRVCIAITLVVMAGMAYVGRGVVVDNRLSAMVDEDAPVQSANARVDEVLGGVITLEVEVSGKPGAFVEPNNLRTLLDLEKKLRTLHKDVRVVQGPAALVARANALLTGKDTREVLPEESALLEQLYFLLGDQPALSALLSEDKSAARIIVSMRDVGAATFREIEEHTEDLLKEMPFTPDVSAYQTGTAGRSYGGILELATDLRQAIFAAFFTIFCIFVVVFRSLRIALISVLPNALPLVAGYALLSALGWTLEPGPAVVFTVALGIAVDDSIHLLFRMREEQRERGSALYDALAFAIVHSGRPVIITTIILCAGFLVNAFSSFPTNTRTGALGAFVIFVALLADLFVLPALLVLFGPKTNASHSDVTEVEL